MAEPTQEAPPLRAAVPPPNPVAATPEPAPPETFRAALAGLVGKVVTVVNPESFEDAPVGHRLTTGFYRAKVLDVGADYLALATEFVHRRGQARKEPVKQYLALAWIKRVSLMRGERIIHL